MGEEIIYIFYADLFSTKEGHYLSLEFVCVKAKLPLLLDALLVRLGEILPPLTNVIDLLFKEEA